MGTVIHNAVYLNSRWELVDLVQSCDKADIENSKAAIDAFWKSHKNSSKTSSGTGFIMAASDCFKFASYETAKFSTVEDKLAALAPLDHALSTKTLLARLGGSYNH